MADGVGITSVPLSVVSGVAATLGVLVDCSCCVELQPIAKHKTHNKSRHRIRFHMFIIVVTFLLSFVYIVFTNIICIYALFGKYIILILSVAGF